jgi:hypothetical protein
VSGGEDCQKFPNSYVKGPAKVTWGTCAVPRQADTLFEVVVTNLSVPTLSNIREMFSVSPPPLTTCGRPTSPWVGGVTMGDLFRQSMQSSACKETSKDVATLVLCNLPHHTVHIGGAVVSLIIMLG